MKNLVIFFFYFCTCQASPDKPNILLILADDMGHNDIGYNNPYIITPNLDELARTGVLLEQSYAQPICTPSRSSLMTGMYPYLIGRQGTPIPHKQPTGLTLDRRLMPDYLKEKGYSTHIIGKWHLGFCKEDYLPTNRGFDTHYGFWGGSEDYYTKWYRHGYDFRDQMELDLVANNSFSEDLYEQRFVEILDDHVENNSESPFFIFMSHQAVHTPLGPPAQYEEMYSDVEDEPRRKFMGTASVLDEKVGVMIQNLKDRNLYESTVVVFLSDNGGNPIIGGGGNNWPLRGFKGTIWDGGVKTPGFVHSPLLNTTGRVTKELFHISDWLPTFYHLAGATQQEIKAQNFSGINQWPTIIDPESRELRTEVVINLDDDKGTTFGAIRQGKYKYVKNPGPWVGWVEPPEGCWNSTCDSTLVNEEENESAEKAINIIHLYDLDNDPEERNDIKSVLPHLVTIMDARMEELKVDMVPADNAEEVDGGNEGGIWNTGWC